MILEKKTTIGDLFKTYPETIIFLKNLTSKYENIDNPDILNLIKDITNLEMLALKGGFEFDILKEKLENFISKS